MKQEKFMTVTPEGIKPKLETHPLFKKNSAALEKALLFCSYLYVRASHFNNSDEENPFQSIRNDKVRLLLGDKFVDYKAALIELEIIEVDESYVNGDYSMGYRLTDKFINQKEKYRGIKYPVVQKKLIRLKDHIFQYILRYHPYLKPQLDNILNIFIDFDAAKEYIKNNNELSAEQKRSYLKHVYKIDSEFKISASVSKTNGRFSSIFVNLPKVLRPFLYSLVFETGEILEDKIEIDGSNTQPLLLLVKMEQEGLIPEPELKTIVFNGTLYDVIAERLNEERDWVKQRFMDSLLYTRSNSKKILKYEKPNELNRDKKKFISYMKINFPIFYKWLYDIKQKYAKEYESNNTQNPGGSALSIEIQRMESDMWIRGLLPRIPNSITYITIHDSIMLFNATEPEKDLVYNEIKSVAKEMYDISDIPLKIKVIK
jgi:hypothetical protein